MKQLIIAACLCMMISNVFANKQYRDFTDVQGRTIRGRVISYDAAQGKVKFERDNRKKGTVPLSMFCDEDQAYIKSGELLRCFTAGSQFRISAKRIRDANDEKSEVLHNKKIDVLDTHFEILLENRSTSKFEGLTLEYCIFYQQEVPGDGKHECKQGVRYGSIDVDAMAPKAKRTYYTEKVLTYKEELDSGWYYYSGSGNVQNGEVHGVWVRVSLKVPGQLKEFKEVSLPDNLIKNQTWTTSTTRAGMN